VVRIPSQQWGGHAPKKTGWWIENHRKVGKKGWHLCNRKKGGGGEGGGWFEKSTISRTYMIERKWVIKGGKKKKKKKKTGEKKSKMRGKRGGLRLQRGRWEKKPENST